MSNDEEQSIEGIIIEIEAHLCVLARCKRAAGFRNFLARTHGQTNSFLPVEVCGLVRRPNATAYQMAASELIAAFGVLGDAPYCFDTVLFGASVKRARLCEELRNRMRKLSPAELAAIKTAVEQYLVTVVLEHPPGIGGY